MKPGVLLALVLVAATIAAQPVHADTPTVIACTWFQWQCWWYPLVFFLSYTVVFMMVGVMGGASGRGMNYLLLAGLTNGSLAASVMGMLTPGVPILLVVLTAIYAVRVR